MTPPSTIRGRAEQLWRQLAPGLLGEAEPLLGRIEAVGFVARLRHNLMDVYDALDRLYGSGTVSGASGSEPAGDLDELVTSLARTALRAVASRSQELRELDRRREVDRQWFQHNSAIGYVCYVDRFCGTLRELPAKLDYLQEQGVTYLHLMPLLQPRPGENDGGYAVMDYRAIDPRVGKMDDLEDVAAALRERGMSLCIDLVLNHTAREHEWARGWVDGDAEFADFYTAFADRELPDAYQATISEVFPDRAPGSFTWFDEVREGQGGWVWTTFWQYQWDLNYANPKVFAAMLETILWLANRGVEIFRMDAVPFMWKRMGTGCMNQPEVHLIMQALHGLVQTASPAVIFKAEAIVAPDDLVPYLGGHERYRPECELAYHNQLMVMLWSSLASKDARLAVQSLRRMRSIPDSTAWVTYARCHDDIGWAVMDSDAAAIGWSGWEHKRFLNEFYAGRYPGSYARGAMFQENPATGDARISGTAASLCGIEQALTDGDAHALELAVRRLVLLHSVTYGFGGVPLLYMGDELALRNDTHYLSDPALRDDNRWMHRPWMDWAAAGRRDQPGTLEQAVFSWLQRLSAARSATLALHAAGAAGVVPVDDSRVLAWWRRHPRSGTFVGLANFGDDGAAVHLDRLVAAVPASARPRRLEVLLGTDPGLDLRDGWLQLPPLGFQWLIDP